MFKRGKKIYNKLMLSRRVSILSEIFKSLKLIIVQEYNDAMRHFVNSFR